ncbi:unnamed protein product [Pleuronectes platessa]|uniref:Uncharacterized protein n=1 Tax=Pleuronectes platessa TaxID=8262 RepID=A0A9N7TIV3_PLEPL|nr:unnamed protein product [Pleuronectes platessa]
MEGGGETGIEPPTIWLVDDPPTLFLLRHNSHHHFLKYLGEEQEVLPGNQGAGCRGNGSPEHLFPKQTDLVFDYGSYDLDKTLNYALKGQKKGWTRFEGEEGRTKENDMITG